MTQTHNNQLTFNLMQIMGHWKLADQEQINLLDLQSLKPRHLYLYKRGDKSFDYNESTVRRAQMVLGINESLATTYPTNRDYAAIWLKKKVKKFKYKTPLELMLGGETGMKRVWCFLDCTQSWKN